MKHYHIEFESPIGIGDTVYYKVQLDSNYWTIDSAVITAFHVIIKDERPLISYEIDKDIKTTEIFPSKEELFKKNDINFYIDLNVNKYGWN